MSEYQGRGRGRARGRARGNVSEATSASGPPSIAPVAAGRAAQRGVSRDVAPGQAPSREMARVGLEYRRDVLITRREDCIKRGTSGRPLAILSNHLTIEHRPDYLIYQYRVDFAPDIESKKLKSGLLFNEHGKLFGEKRLFDGTLLYLPKRLPSTVTELTSIRSFDGTAIKIKISLKHEMSPDDPGFVQIANIILRKMLRIMGLKEIMHSYFNPNLTQQAGHGLEVWPGISMTFERFESNLLLNLDLSFKVLRTTSVYSILNDLRQRPNFQDEARRALLGQTVMTSYNTKTYPVTDIDFNSNPLSTFDKKGTPVSYVQYYRDHYSLQINNVTQPMLVSVPKKKDQRDRKKDQGQDGPIFLVPELCQLTGIPDAMKKDFRVMQDLAKFTRKNPEERKTELLKFRGEIGRSVEASHECQLWGFRFSERLLSMTGRTLDPERLFQKDIKRPFSYDPKSADWSRECRGQQLITGVPIKKWLLLCTPRDEQLTRDFESVLIRVGQPMGMQIGPSTFCRLNNDSIQSYKQTLLTRLDKDVQLAVLIVPTNRGDRYDAIKKFCCVENAVPSQVIVSRTISKSNMLMSVATKVAIQINCKLGGETWGVSIPLKKLMVIGVDSYHDSARKGRSVGAVVANLNPSHTRYYSRSNFQSSGQEMLDGLHFSCVSALKEYHKLNGFLPTQIIMYRDGVGDGQIRQVFETEVPQIKKSFHSFGDDYDPKFALVIVKKRHNTKLFADMNGRLFNPPPGTIVDSEVTKREWFDFFLISQSVRQGTVGPTHYNVVYDETGFDADKFQRLTYKLTHLYYNWQGTIRVPAVCQYAHKLAFLVGQSLHDEPSIELASNLFYL